MFMFVPPAEALDIVDRRCPLITTPTASMHWPEPNLARSIDAGRGPVLATVEYRIKPDDRSSFPQAITKLADERRRHGASEWDLFEHLSLARRFLEIFKLDSWIEHSRQHERVTRADRQLQDLVNSCQIDDAPKPTPLVAPR